MKKNELESCCLSCCALSWLPLFVSVPHVCVCVCLLSSIVTPHFFPIRILILLVKWNFCGRPPKKTKKQRPFVVAVLWQWMRAFEIVRTGYTNAFAFDLRSSLPFSLFLSLDWFECCVQVASVELCVLCRKIMPKKPCVCV